MKRPNLRLTEIEEEKQSQIKGSENIFNKIIEEKFPKEVPIEVQEAYSVLN